MFGEVVDFLIEAKNSNQQFDKLQQFYKFRDNISHKQNFLEVCKEIALFFEEVLSTSGMKITTYDIEKSHEMELYSYGKEIKNINGSDVISYDFSKSYALNGRIFFLIEDTQRLQEINNNKSWLNFMFYEMKTILLNYLAMEKIKENSYVDDVTSLPNRRFLISHLRSLFAIAKKEEFKIALLKVEIDHFKAIVEEFNYEIGTNFLKKVAKVLQNNISNTDIVTRFEGNTFLVCMQDIKDNCEASVLAKKCIDEFAKEFVIVNHKTSQKLFKTICIGIVVYPDDGNSFDDLFRNCDIALDEAKNKGRSSYEFYQTEQNCAISLF